MYDVVTIGSAIVDTYVHSDGFTMQERGDGVYLCEKYHEKIQVDKLEMVVGGGGANTAICLARLGLHVGIIAELGEDTGCFIVEHTLKKEQVNTSLLIKEKKEQTGGAVILIGPDGGRTALVHRAAASMLDPHDIPVDRLSRVGWIHMSNIGGRVSTLRSIFEAVHDKKLSWNPGKEELWLLANGTLKLSDVRCSIFSVNKEEWAILGEVHSEVLSTIPEVIITDGKNGCTIHFGGHERVFPAKSLTAVDETGAGDAFVSTYAGARYLGQPPLIALNWARENAASVVGHVGPHAGLLGRASLAASKKVS